MEMREFVAVAGETASAMSRVAGRCVRPVREFLTNVIRAVALTYLSAKGNVSARISGDWFCATIGAYLGFRNGILYVTDDRGFAAQDWKNGIYDLRKEDDGYLLIMDYDGQKNSYVFAQVDAETFTIRNSERATLVFKSLRYTETHV